MKYEGESTLYVCTMYSVHCTLYSVKSDVTLYDMYSDECYSVWCGLMCGTVCGVV